MLARYCLLVHSVRAVAHFPAARSAIRKWGREEVLSAASDTTCISLRGEKTRALFSCAAKSMSQEA